MISRQCIWTFNTCAVRHRVHPETRQRTSFTKVPDSISEEFADLALRIPPRTWLPIFLKVRPVARLTHAHGARCTVGLSCHVLSQRGPRAFVLERRRALAPRPLYNTSSHVSMVENVFF